MRISELIAELEQQKKRHGDLHCGIHTKTWFSYKLDDVNEVRLEFCPKDNFPRIVISAREL